MSRGEERGVNVGGWARLMHGVWCVLFGQLLFAASSLAASATITAVDQGNGGVLVTATGTFDTCTYCDANGKNCSSTNNGSIAAYRDNGFVCSKGGSGSATCTATLDRGTLHGPHNYSATASDCKGSSSAADSTNFDNTPSVSVASPVSTVEGAFDILAHVTFAPTLSATKGSIDGYIDGGFVLSKTCTTEACTLSFKEQLGRLYDGAHGQHTLTIRATGGGATTTDTSTFIVDNTPKVAVVSPKDTVEGAFDINAQVTFKPQTSATKGTIYGYIDGAVVCSKTCTTEACTLSFKEQVGRLYDGAHGKHELVIRASGGGATTTDTSTFTVDNTPKVEVVSPKDTVEGAFDINAQVTFKPQTSATKGTIYGYIDGAVVCSKTCTTEACTLSFKEQVGRLYDGAHGQHTLTIRATGGGATTTDTSTFIVDNAPKVSVVSPKDTVEGAFDINAQVTFKPQASATKGSIYGYIDGGFVLSKTCTTEACTLSFKEQLGRLYDGAHGKHELVIRASGGGATTTDTSTFIVDNAPKVSVVSPKDTVEGAFDINAQVTFKPQASATKGSIDGYIDGGFVLSKTCTTEACTLSFKEQLGRLYDGAHGQHTLTIRATGGGATTTDTSTFTVDNAPKVSVSAPEGNVRAPFDIIGKVQFKPITSATKGTIYAYINGGFVTSKSCTTESCSFSYKEMTGNLYTLPPGSSYTVKLTASGGGASASDEKAFFVEDLIPDQGCPEPASDANSCCEK